MKNLQMGATSDPREFLVIILGSLLRSHGLLLNAITITITDKLLDLNNTVTLFTTSMTGMSLQSISSSQVRAHLWQSCTENDNTTAKARNVGNSVMSGLMS